MTDYLLYRTADLLSRIVPRRFAYWVGLRIADHFCRRDTRGRAAVKANLRRVIEAGGTFTSDASLDIMARQTFQCFAKYLVDFFRFGNMSERQIRRLVSIEHWEYMQQAQAMGKGVLAVTAHFGNWELGGCAMAALGSPMTVVVLPQTGEKLNRLFQDYRRKRGMNVLLLGQSVRRVIALLRQKQIVALLADRDYSPHNSLVEFFAAPAALPRGPAWLCEKTGAPLVPGFMLRKPDDTFLLRFHPPIVAGEGETAEQIQRRLCVILEKEISQNPVQWMMFDDIWDGKGYGQ